MAVCNICGNDEFATGPGGRHSVGEELPRCTKCNSLERHRSNRVLFETLRDGNFLSGTALQFSPDLSASPDWFDRYEVSVYGRENSLDLQKIDRASGSYDVLICNHVLEHVPYDNSALCELIRICKDNGLVFLSVPDPARRKVTKDWGYADENDHGHYRIYGIDIEDMFRTYIDHAKVLAAGNQDPVTGMKNQIYLLFRNPERCAAVKAWLEATNFFYRLESTQ